MTGKMNSEKAISIYPPDPAWDVATATETPNSWNIAGKISDFTKQVIRPKSEIVEGLKNKMSLSITDFSSEEVEAMLKTAYKEFNFIHKNLDLDERSELIKFIKSSDFYRSSKELARGYAGDMDTPESLKGISENFKIFASAFFDEHIIPLLEIKEEVTQVSDFEMDAENENNPRVEPPKLQVVA